MSCIHYSSGYKYQLRADYVLPVGLPGAAETEWLTLRDGTLTIRNGYAWDGPSGPTIDTLNFMRGSLVHDALYQLIRLDFLSPAARVNADQLLYDLCIEDGMSKLRAWWVWIAVRKFGTGSCRPHAERPILTAP